MPFESLSVLVPLAPLLAALAIAAGRLIRTGDGDAAERPTACIATASVAVSLLLMLALDAAALAQVLPDRVHIGAWFVSGRFEVPISFALDTLSLALGTLVALIAFLGLRFSVNYMHREAGFHRFFFAMSLFSAGMLLIVLSGNAVLCFVGWELAGVSSYLLIGYSQERAIATDNAVRAFVTNRIGDAGFLVGIAAAFHWVGTLEWQEIGAGAVRLETLPAGLMALGFVTAAAAKSAQVPFAPWVARALEGPTPSSAIFYGSLMIHAGVYLLIRLEPVLEHSAAVMALVAVLGVATVLYGWLSGLVQTDVKSALTFATTTQVGLMFLECGLGWFDVAAWHLALHASWRAYQFLLAPSYMHLVSGPAQPAPRWLVGRRWLYTTALQRFWLEAVGDWLLLRPTRELGRDMNAFDSQVVDRATGSAEPSRRLRTGAENEAELDSVARGYGIAGRLLEIAASRLVRFEQHLLLQSAGGRLTRALAQMGDYLRAVEALLEQPRYLLLLIMATFAVIL
jgi:NADH:ubiquinone oxidoreductase subunit 5 (subunit L)/multisubunit Na+/H+ antiporter MnhA subunit